MADTNSALAYAESQADGSDHGWYEKCQTFVRTALGFDHGTAASAADAWSKTPKAAQHTDGSTPPQGVPVYWTGGSQGYGHVALSAGGGYVYTTDFGGKGTVSLQPINAINLAWHDVHYAGWADTEAASGKLYGSDAKGHSASWNDVLHPTEIWKDAKGVVGGAVGAAKDVADVPGAIKSGVESVIGWVKTGLIRSAFFILGALFIAIFLFREAQSG